MSNALLSDVEARAQRRLLRTRQDVLDEEATRAWRAATDAADPAENLRWLERAHRLAPLDGMVATSLAGALLAEARGRNAPLDRPLELFRAQARQHDAMEAWAGLAACAHLSGRAALAQKALTEALRRFVPNDTLLGLAHAIGAHAGWCALDTEGRLTASVRPLAVRMDGVELRLSWARNSARLPAAWRTAGVIEVEGPRGPLLGSPLPAARFAGVEGFVEAEGCGLTGWAWRPADAARPARLLVAGGLGEAVVLANGDAAGLRHSNPFAQPRRFTLSAARAATLGELLRVTGPDGRDLLGSPIDPAIELRPSFVPAWVDRGFVAPPTALPKPALQIDVVIPVFRGLVETLACLDSVLAGLRRGVRVIVVDDASPDPALRDALDRLARQKRITLLRLERNRGFPGAANAGMERSAQAGPGRDVVLLNSDTLVPPGWLERLRRAAYSAADIGSVTPLTNDGSIVSIPDPAGGNPVPDLVATLATDALAQKANGEGVADIPVGVGFCLYLRHDCLNQVGLFREDLFAQGYGEENDLCLRARQQGWRNVAAAGVFVGHVGATSFRGGKAHLIRRNTALLERLHPGYGAVVAAHVAADPLAPARQRMDALRWAAGRNRAGAVVLVTHGGGGGVDRVIDARVRAIRAAGARPIVLRPAAGDGVRMAEPDAAPFPNLVFPMPGGLPGLVRLLRADRVTAVELHHTLGHHADIAGLPGLLGVPGVSVIHDYARFCGRIALVGPNRAYCGEPDLAGCEACVADLGSLLEDDPPMPALIERSARELAGAARIVAPSMDAARRMRRHFPAIRAEVEPWEDDAALPPVAAPRAAEALHVAIIGAIGTEKGYDVLLGCVRDARRRGLALRFTVVGYTADDARLMQAGPVFVTGEYRDADAVALIRAQGAHLAFIPSVWPETWCFALSRAWQAGLQAAVFDLGAQAERVRATGRGWLLPLGLPPGAVNDALLRLAPPLAAPLAPPLAPQLARSPVACNVRGHSS